MKRQIAQKVFAFPFRYLPVQHEQCVRVEVDEETVRVGKGGEGGEEEAVVVSHGVAENKPAEVSAVSGGGRGVERC